MDVLAGTPRRRRTLSDVFLEPREEPGTRRWLGALWDVCLEAHFDFGHFRIVSPSSGDAVSGALDVPQGGSRGIVARWACVHE